MSTAQRAEAYGRVIQQLDDLSGSKLQLQEQDVVREAADSLLFTHDIERDPEAEAALVALYSLADRMVDSERMSRERAGELVRAVESCGPALAAY